MTPTSDADAAAQPRPRRPAVVLGITLVAVSLVIGVAVGGRDPFGFDLDLVRSAAPLRDVPVLGWVLRMASRIGYAWGLVPTVLATSVVVAGTTRSRARTALVASATLVTAVVTTIEKDLFDRPRPTLDPDVVISSFSMPSGHSSASAAFAMSVALCVPAGRARTTAGVALGLFALTVGLSRVVLGVHFPTDVAAGWCLGAGLALLVAAALRVPRG